MVKNVSEKDMGKKHKRKRLILILKHIANASYILDFWMVDLIICKFFRMTCIYVLDDKHGGYVSDIVILRSKDSKFQQRKKIKKLKI